MFKKDTEMNKITRPVVREYELSDGTEITATIKQGATGTMVHHLFTEKEDTQAFLDWLKTDSPLTTEQKDAAKLARITETITDRDHKQGSPNLYRVRVTKDQDEILESYMQNKLTKR